MTGSPSQLKGLRTLRALLAERGALPAPEVLRLTAALAEQVAALHENGRLHGALHPDVISVDAELMPLPASPGTGSLIRLDLGELAILLPQLTRLVPPELPVEIEAAQQQLRELDISLDPRRIDLCQLGALFCWLVAGESAGAYLRSPRVRGKVPLELRPFLRQALGCDPEQTFADARELLGAVEVLGQQYTMRVEVSYGRAAAPGAPHFVARSPGDTTPSFVSSENDPADTSVPARSATPASESTAGSPLPFLRLGHYEIVGRIGRGGMGDVYEGYERALDRKVAIKVLPADLARSDEFVRRFRIEATAVARLNHPNIVPIHSIGEDQGHHFYVMQFVAGESLADLLARRGRLSVDETLHVVEQALSGLAAAHERGMVHRDIKPGNILLDAQSQRALLADFGLVKSLESSVTGRTATGVVMGTVDYISPEQGRGLPVDCRSDLYSIGVLLYRMLSGRLPFTAESPTALIFQHVYEQPPEIRGLVPDLPEPLALVVDKLLAKLPANRHQSAPELLAELQALRPQAARRAAPVWHPWPRTQEAPTALIRAPAIDELPPLPASDLMGAKSLGWWVSTRDRALSLFRRHAPEALLALQNTRQQMDGAVALYARRQREFQQLEQEAESVVRELQRQANSQREAAQAARRQASANPAEAHREQAEELAFVHAAEQLEQQAAEQREQLDLIRLRLAQVTARGQELQNQRDILGARLAGAAARAGAAAPSSRGRLLRLPRWRIATLAQLALLAVIGAFCAYVILDRDSQSLRQTDDGLAATDRAPWPKSNSAPVRAETVEIDRTPAASPVFPLRQFPETMAYVHHLAFDPTGSILAVSGNDSAVRLWNVETGTGLGEFPAHGSSILTFSRSGRWLVIESPSEFRGQGTLSLWNVKAARRETVFSGETHRIMAVSVSPDESSVVALCELPDRAEVIQWERETGQEQRRFTLGSAKIRGGDFSPDGTLLEAVLYESQTALWDVARGTKIRDLEEPVVMFDHSGSRLLSYKRSGEISLWSVPDGNLVKRFNLDIPDHIASISPGPGQRLLVGTSDDDQTRGTAYILDLESGKIRKQLPGYALSVAAFSPDGRRLATGGGKPPVLLWDATLDAPKSSTPQWEREEGSPMTVAADGKSVLTGGQKGEARFWRTSSEKWKTLPGAPDKVVSLSLSPDGRLAAAGGSEGEVALWNTQEGQLVRKSRLFSTRGAGQPRPAGAMGVGPLAFTPDGSRIVVLCNGKLLAWDVEAGGESTLWETRAHRLCMSSDGRHLATGGWNDNESSAELELWDLETRTRVRRLLGHVHYVSGLAFSPDGLHLASGGKGHVHVWSVQTGDEVLRINLPVRYSSGLSNDGATGVCYSLDGTKIAATGHQLISIWDAATGEEVFRCEGPQLLQTEWLGFAADGQHVFAGDKKRQVTMWDIQ